MTLKIANLDTLPLISIVLSSYNDRDIIMPFHEAIVQELENQNRYRWELVYVDDGSLDGSVDTLKQLAEQDERVIFIELARNFGQQKAFFAGMKQASGDIIITLDGDYQYQPDCILILADKIREGFDVVSGIRNKRRDPWISKVTSRIGRGFVRRALRYPVTDFGAVKGFSRFIVDKILHYENYCVMPYGMAFALSHAIAEVPVNHRPRPSGKSKWNFTKRLHMYFDLYLAHAPYESTNLVRIGFYAISAGGATLAFLLYLYLAHGIFHFRSFTAIWALCLIGGGITLTFFSFVMSFMLRIYRQLLWRGQCTILREIHFHQESKSATGTNG